MDQNQIWPNRNQRRSQTNPPVVSGAEIRRQRTGIATRTGNELFTKGIQVRAAKESALSYTRAELSKDDTGIIPENAPLANPYVPFQRENPQRYPLQRGLARGTMYPGLDLPYMDKVNSDLLETPMSNLMALEFAVIELGMYLDTHPEDMQALEVYREYVDRAQHARRAYEEGNGPLFLESAAENDKWDWISNPWPWDYCQEG